MTNTKTEDKSKAANANKSSRSKTTKSGRTHTVSSAKATPEVRAKRAKSVMSKSEENKNKRVSSQSEKGLADLFEHAMRDMYYAEKKIYRSLPKMIKAAEDASLIEALTMHREETQDHIAALESAFEAMGLRAKGIKCDAIDGIIEEAEGILEDFSGTLAGDAAIIFCAGAVEHYEIARYTSMIGFADALGLDKVHKILEGVLNQELSAKDKLNSLAEGSINEAASEYDSDD